MRIPSGRSPPCPRCGSRQSNLALGGTIEVLSSLRRIARRGTFELENTVSRLKRNSGPGGSHERRLPTTGATPATP